MSFNHENTYFSVARKINYTIKEQIDKKSVKQSGEDHVFFNASKLSNLNINFWKNYCNEQDIMTRRNGVPNKDFGIIDGVGSFLHSLSMFNETNNYDIWIIHASSKIIDDKFTDLIDIKIKDERKTNLYSYDEAKRIDCDSIEMCFTLFIDKNTPVTTHMGIFRNWKYFGNYLYGIKSHMNLSSYLHSFSAKLTQLLYPKKIYMITNPAHKMREIFKKSLIEYHDKLKKENPNIKLENVVVIGNNKQRNKIRYSIKHKYNSEPENIKKIIDNLREIFLEKETLLGRQLYNHEKEELIDSFFFSKKIYEKKIINNIKSLNNNEKIKSYNDYIESSNGELLPTNIEYNPPLHYIDDKQWSITYNNDPPIIFDKPDWFKHRDLLNHLPTIIVDINYLGNMHFQDYNLLDDDYRQ